MAFVYRLSYVRKMLLLLLVGFNGIKAASEISQEAHESLLHTFTSPMKTYAQDHRGLLYVGAGAEGAGEFALMRLDSGAQDLIGLALSKTTLNGQENQNNPFFNASIKHLAVLELKGLSGPIVVTANGPSDIYVLNSFSKEKISVLSAENICDAEGRPSKDIVCLEGGAGSHIFAAVTGDQAEKFGEKGSGIGVVLYKTIEVEVKEEEKEEGKKKGTNNKDDKKKTSKNQDGKNKNGKNNEEKNEEEVKKKIIQFLQQINAYRANTADVGPWAVPLDRTSDSVKVNGDLSKLGEKIAMHWDNTLGNLYVGLQVESGAHSQDGAFAIIVGTFDQNNKLILSSLAHGSSLENAPFFALGGHAKASAHALKTMHTSTNLAYLIVQGGKGSPEETRRTVYALPLVNNAKGIQIYFGLLQCFNDVEALLKQTNVQEPEATNQKKNKTAGDYKQLRKIKSLFGDLIKKLVKDKNKEEAKQDGKNATEKNIIEEKLLDQFHKRIAAIDKNMLGVNGEAALFQRIGGVITSIIQALNTLEEQYKTLKNEQDKQSYFATLKSTISKSIEQGQEALNHVSIIHGCLANKCEDITISNQGIVDKILHGFKGPAINAEEIVSSDDPAAQVGGGSSLPGDIATMMIHNDTVIVAIAQSKGNMQSGIFYSKALLDASGKIKSWTHWQRLLTTFDAAGNMDNVLWVGFDGFGSTLLITGAEKQSIKNIKRVGWGTGKEKGLHGLVEQLKSEFPEEKGGVHVLHGFSSQMRGMRANALFVAAGMNKIALIKTGQCVKGILQPQGGSFSNKQKFIDGKISNEIPDDISTVIVSGGALEEIGPITSVETVCGSADLLCVGGSRGLAILCDDANNEGGCGEANQHFACLRKGMSFQKIGDFTFVKKLIADQQYLYVLTDSALHRIDFSSPEWAKEITVLAYVENLPEHSAYDCLLDVVISEKFALLGTSRGLFRVGNGCDIASAPSPEYVGWTEIILPESYGPVMQLLSVSATGRDQDVVRYQGGMVYVLNGYAGKDQAQVYRFAIDSLEQSMITDATVQLIPHYNGKGNQIPWLSLRDFKRRLITDLELFTGISLKNNSVTNDKTLIKAKFSTILRTTPIPACGNRLINSVFGLQVHE